MKKYSAKRPNKGFSLVDTMVGMVIAMIGMIIIFQVFSVSEGVKRTTTGGSDAQQSSAVALVTLERALKSAGYGIFTTVSETQALTDASNPITITFGANPWNSDVITIVSRRNWAYASFFEPTVINTVVPPRLTTETIFIDNNNDFSGTPAIAPAIVTASVRNNAKAQLQLVSVTSMAPNAVPAYPVVNPIVADIGNEIADGVVLMKAQYGTDGANGNPIDGTIQPGEWSTAAPGNPWSVLAVRLVVVSRSAQPEKPDPVAGVCTTTQVAPTWVGTLSVAGSAASPLSLAGQADLIATGDDWKCYRYKTFETTVPMRSIMWH